jgi:hypothetical protein
MAERLSPCMGLVTILALFAGALSAEGITIVLDFDGPHLERSTAEMKREFEGNLEGRPRPL